MSRGTLLWLSADRDAHRAGSPIRSVATVGREGSRQGGSRREPMFRPCNPVSTVLGGIVLAADQDSSLRPTARAAFGDAWTDDTDAPGGHNGL